MRKRTFWNVRPTKTLIRMRIQADWTVFVVHMKTFRILGYLKCVQRRFWSDCANAQDDLNLRRENMSECTLSNVTAQMWQGYSWLSLSRPRVSRITAYLEVKIWSQLKNENLITGNKILWKRGELLLRSNFSSFPQYFQYISNFKSPITYTFVKCGCSIYFFLKSANLICRSTDITKYFRESLGIRDNESRLYIGITF